MDRVLLDTNIILDYLSGTRPCHLDAVDLLDALLTSNDLEPLICLASLKDAYYILCRHLKNEPVVRQRLDAFRQVVTCCSLTPEVADVAFACDEPDLEDALVRATAELEGARAIISRDERAFVGSAVPRMTAWEFTRSLD